MRLPWVRLRGVDQLRTAYLAHATGPASALATKPGSTDGWTV